MRILGLDFGEKRIGVAMSDPSEILASPLTVIEAKSTNIAIEQIVSLTQEHEIEHIVVGLPRSLDGSEGKQAQVTRDFIDLLQSQVDIPVDTWDERLSTVAANRMMNEAGVKKGKKKKRLDSAAATIILQSYLDRKQ